MASFNLDRSFYQLWISEKDWAGKPNTYTPQTDLEDMQNGFNKLVEFMRDAFEVASVSAVIEFNPAEGWSRDITADVIAAMQDDDGDDNREHRIGAFEAGVGAFA